MRLPIRGWIYAQVLVSAAIVGLIAGFPPAFAQDRDIVTRPARRRASSMAAASPMAAAPSRRTGPAPGRAGQSRAARLPRAHIRPAAAAPSRRRPPRTVECNHGSKRVANEPPNANRGNFQAHPNQPSNAMRGNPRPAPAPANAMRGSGGSHRDFSSARNYHQNFNAPRRFHAAAYRRPPRLL